MDKIRVKGFEVGIFGLKEIFREVNKMNIPQEEKKKLILEKVKDKNYIPENVEKEFEDALWREFRKWKGERVEEEEEYAFIDIRILGTGCPRCEKLIENTKNALSELNLPAQVNEIKDIKEISRFGVFSTPALIINGKIISQGKVLGKEEIKEILRKFK